LPFKIERTNSDKATTQLGAQEYATGELAFRAAMGNVVDFITAHWDTATGANVNGPADNTTFKIYIKRKIPPVQVNLRYDWLEIMPSPLEDRGRTNDIVWVIIEV